MLISIFFFLFKTCYHNEDVCYVEWLAPLDIYIFSKQY